MIVLRLEGNLPNQIESQLIQKKERGLLAQGGALLCQTNQKDLSDTKCLSLTPMCLIFHQTLMETTHSNQERINSTIKCSKQHMKEASTKVLKLKDRCLRKRERLGRANGTKIKVTQQSRKVRVINTLKTLTRPCPQEFQPKLVSIKNQTLNFTVSRT